ncbi:unnamed protein product [Rotaria sp. Silwood1]|nr:unnamed protein product [Rotaria sp. Silwood1]
MKCLRTIRGLNLGDRVSNQTILQLSGQPSLENPMRRNRLRWFGHANPTPVLYALLNDKKAYTYTLLFRALKRAAREMKMNFSPSRIITDFEKAMSKKLKKFGLWTYYTKNNDLHLFLKKVMAIVLLIPSLMDDAFESLRNEYLENTKF